ncbi:type VI immunity family protein [Sorangium sp. So ce134]
MTPAAPLEPLADYRGIPQAYSSLGAFFHCELAEPGDEARFDRVNELIFAWFGRELRWSVAPFFRNVVPFRASDLEYISGYCASLELSGASREDRDALTLFHFGRDGYSIYCNGGSSPTAASPYLYGFWAELTGDEPEQRFPACPVLRLHVPDTWPADDFAARVTAIAAQLRLRWASAGYTYASWDVSGDAISKQAIYAHARRFHGYDIPEYAGDAARFMNEIRSVNWLTFLGPALARRLRELGRELKGAGPLRVGAAGDAVVLRAGDRPERGDINRLQIPRAYQDADALVRPIRAGGGVTFLGPWTKTEVSEWLQRFGKGGAAPPPPPAPDEDLPF